MGIFEKNKTGGLMDEIRCDEESYLIWKWHPSGTRPGKSERENSIRWGSSLRVKEGEVAVFVYRQNGQVMQDFITGPFDKVLDTMNLPVLADIIGLAYEGGTPFQAEVYFINLANVIQVRFAVPFFDVYDPRYIDFGVTVAVRGTVTFRIEDYKNFIKLHRLYEFDLEDFRGQIKDVVSRYVKSVVTNAPAKNQIPVIQIETRIEDINKIVEDDLIVRLREDFGVLVSGVDIGAIEIDKNSDGYRNLMHITRGIATEKLEAEKTDYIERMRIQRQELQYAQHKSTQSANIGAFQTEMQAQVGIAGAEALGKMGENGAGSVNLGGDSVGFNPAAMMAGMAVGSGIGQNIAGTMNNMMSGMNQRNVSSSNGIAGGNNHGASVLVNGLSGENNPATSVASGPPPIPGTVYHVVINGVSSGPFTLKEMSKMAEINQLNADTLIWTNGMKDWDKAVNIPEVKDILK